MLFRSDNRKHVVDSSSVNVKSWRTVGADKLLNSRLSPLNSQLKRRLVSKLPGLFIRIGYPAVGLEKTKKKVNDLKIKTKCQEQILIHYWKPVVTSVT